jgi:hypothetical protein
LSNINKKILHHINTKNLITFIIKLLQFVKLEKYQNQLLTTHLNIINGFKKIKEYIEIQKLQELYAHVYTMLVPKIMLKEVI